MDKYIIVNEAYNSILCKDKYSSRRYRQDRNNIDKHCVIVKTTKGRAEQERDYLNKNYNEGWEIQKVEPIVFYDNAKDREKYFTEYETLREEEIKQIQQIKIRDDKDADWNSQNFPKGSGSPYDYGYKGEE